MKTIKLSVSALLSLMLTFCVLTSWAQNPPVITNINGTICAGDNAQFRVTTSCTINTWLASPGGVIQGASNQQVVIVKWASAQANAWIQVSYTNCNTSFLALVVNAVSTPSVTMAISDNTICQPQTVLLTASPTNVNGSPTYKWYVDGGLVATTSVNSSNYSPTSLAVGNHTAYVNVSTMMCSSLSNVNSPTINFSVNPNVGQVSTPSGISSRCTGSGTDNFSASATNALSYTWSLTAGAGSISSSGVVTWGSAYSGTATVGITAYGCNGSSTTASTNVNVSGLGTIVISGTASRCMGSGLDAYSASANNANTITYRVEPTTAGNMVSGAAGYLTWNASFYGVAIITARATGCNTTDSTTKVVVVDRTVGQVSYPFGATEICQGTTQTTYTASATNNKGGYTWSLTSGAGSINYGVPNQGVSTATVTWNPSFTGNATVGVTALGCGSTSRSIIVKVSATPSTSISPNGIISTIPATLTAPLVTGYSYVWLINGNPTSNQDNTLVVDAPGTYGVKVTLGECTAVAPIPATVILGNYGIFSDPNYIKERTALVEKRPDGQPVTETDMGTLAIGDRQEVINYFDGLGRPMQKVVTKGSPLGSDVVQPMIFDNYGREQVKYLPYVTGTDGSFKSTFLPREAPAYATSPQYLFYQNTSKVSVDAVPYSVSVFEPSPLNRVVKQGSPGTAWQPDATNTYASTDRTVKKQYVFNTANEVLNFAPVAPVLPATPLGSIALQTPNYYTSYLLVKNNTKDEQQNEATEYVDKLGHTILKKVKIDATTYAQTYYIYNEQGNLTCVLPPEATQAILNQLPSGSPATAISQVLPTLSFQYAYDERNRMAIKKLPGADPVFMVYDARDRLVMTQDGNLRKNTAGTDLKNWLFTKYDGLDRPVLTGIYTAATVLDRAAMQSAVNAYYNALATNSGAWFETFKTTNGTTHHGYDNKSYPLVTNAANYLTVTYYDNYDFKTTFGSAEFNFKTVEIPSSPPLDGQISAESSRVRGLITGTKTRMINSASWLKAVKYYDSKGRLVQSISENPKGHEVTTNVLDFVGRVTRTRTTLYTGQPVVWTGLTSVNLVGETLTSSTPTNWSAGGASTQALTTTADGWAEFTVLKTSPQLGFGLTQSNGNNNISTTLFAWNLTGTTAQPYTGGAVVGSAITVIPGDLLRVERVNGLIYWKRNGMIVHPAAFPSTITSATTLIADVAFFTTGATLTKVRLSPTFSTFAATPQYTTNRFVYDASGRLAQNWSAYNGGAEIMLVKNEYNELGQVVDKKLHSTVGAGTDAKQSIDYRYNIRGWLSRINSSDIVTDYNDGTNSGEARDLFGMNLAYNEDLGTGNYNANPALDLRTYNGNISAIKWSTNQALGAVKELAYNFGYDGISRLKDANHRKLTAPATWAAGDYDENTILHDLNGNIKNLKRKGKGGVQIDDLVYNYGSGATLSNKLLSVTDNVTNATDKLKGFTDGNTSGDDFTYDINGNMLTDKNKNITANITYNYLNLPENVARDNNNVTYFYDATGRKHGQLAISNNAQKFTEYISAWVFENNEAQFVQHDEGRIALIDRKQVFISDGDDAASYAATASITPTPQTVNGETYMKIAPSGNGINMTKLGATIAGSGPGGSFTVVPGERYVFRAKGYSNLSKVPYLYVKGNSSDLIWPGASLPLGATSEMWVEEAFTIPAGTTQITIGILYNTAAPSVTGDYFLVNNLELTRVSTGSPVYQYNLKDHLGNVRTTFTTVQPVTAVTATFESANQPTEAGQFTNYPGASQINNVSMNAHSGTSSEYLNGTTIGHGLVGVAKTFSVMPGDQLQIQAYAKYGTPSGTASNLSVFATALLAAFNVPAPGVGETGTARYALNYYGGLEAGGYADGSQQTDPKVFVTIVLFDRDYNYLGVSFDQVETSGSLLSASVTVQQPGYAYMYISNEHPNLLDVYFDDVTMTFTPSPVIQTDDYYPFGLTFNSYQRENSLLNKWKFQGQEHVDDLGLNWDSFKWRNHQPDIGRFFNVDPLAEKYVYNSPYAFSENHVTSHVELEGLEKVSINVRHFIPEARTGGGFYRGDNRGFTTSQNVTSRISHTVTVDTQSKGFTTSTTSSPTKMYPAGPLSDKGIEKTATPDVKSVGVSTSGNSINVSSEYSAKDPLAAGVAPAIDFKNSFTVTPDYANGSVTVSGTTSGDQYPAAESFVTDEKGNSVFVGVAPAEGNITDSYGTGDKTLINSTVKIATDANGNFTGVYGSDGKVVPIADHNKTYQSTKPNQ